MGLPLSLLEIAARRLGAPPDPVTPWSWRGMCSGYVGILGQHQGLCLRSLVGILDSTWIRRDIGVWVPDWGRLALH